MVQITPEEVMARKKSEMEFGGLADSDREHIGAAMRLEIPFTDEFKMRQIADMLRGLAADFDSISRNVNLPLSSRLWLMKRHAAAVNKRIRNLHGNFNKNGTTRKDSGGSNGSN